MLLYILVLMQINYHALNQLNFSVQCTWQLRGGLLTSTSNLVSKIRFHASKCSFLAADLMIFLGIDTGYQYLFKNIRAKAFLPDEITLLLSSLGTVKKNWYRLDSTYSEIKRTLLFRCLFAKISILCLQYIDMEQV